VALEEERDEGDWPWFWVAFFMLSPVWMLGFMALVQYLLKR
jgi:hypothetical protein